MNYEEKAEESQFTPTDDAKEQRCKKYVYTNEKKHEKSYNFTKKKEKAKSMYQ